MPYPRPTKFFNDIFPDKKDPNNPRTYLCRYCGKPTIDSDRRYYCSDECYWLCQKAVSWSWRRRLVYRRDDGRCVRCREKVKLEGGGYKSRSEIHHIMHVKEIWLFCWDMVGEWTQIGEIQKSQTKRIFAKIYTLMYLDMNNLETLCFSCHNMVHAADNRSKRHLINQFEIAPTYWTNFWKWAEKDKITKTLDEFFS